MKEVFFFSPKQTLRTHFSPKQTLRTHYSPKQTLRTHYSPKRTLRTHYRPKQTWLAPNSWACALVDLLTCWLVGSLAR